MDIKIIYENFKNELNRLFKENKNKTFKGKDIEEIVSRVFFDNIIARADIALYSSKENWKDRVTSFEYMDEKD